ncbi:MAG: TetR/AcrR family transcriptional regulator [Hyphomicrobiaceae bacterium]
MRQKKNTSARADIASRKQAFVREEILTSATHLFAERGYRAVTIDDIASNLGYTKSVVYYYFKSKNEILWQIVSRIFEGYLQKIVALRDDQLAPDQLLAAMVRQHALNVMEYPEWTSIFNREETELEPNQRRQVRKMKRDYDALFEQVYEAGVAKGLFRKIPPHVAIGGAMGMCNWLYVWYNPKGPLSAEEIADHYAGILSGGWCTRAS